MLEAEPGARGPRSRAELVGARMVDLGRDIVRSMSTRMLSPRGLLSGAMGAAQASASGLWALLPASRSPDAWLETANKLRSYRLFACADLLVPEAENGWADALDRLRDMDPFSRVWVTEGLGYYFAQRGVAPVWGTHGVSMSIPMHTGLGLSLAERALRSVGGGALSAVLDAFRRDAWASAHDGYGEVVFEALGLIAVSLFPDLVVSIDRELAADEQLCALFWHGVGRGLYFLPLHFLPASRARERPIDFAVRTPSTAMGRQNALAGLAWAMTLVNVQDPEVIAHWVAEFPGGAPAGGALRNGIASALIVWMASAPDDSSAGSLASYDPPAPLAALWEESIRGPIEKARRRGGAASLAAAMFRVRVLN